MSRSGRPVAVAVLGTLAVMLDAAVNIAFPAISAAFGVPVTSIQWVVLTYVVTFALGLVPAGRLADRVGADATMRAGLGVTALTHLACGLAPGWPWLLAARAAQGLGAALVMASAPALVTLATPAERHGRALASLGIATSAGGVLGPLLGGVLVGAAGWRVVYLGRVPLSLVALALGAHRPPAPGPTRGGPARGAPGGPLGTAAAPALGASGSRGPLVLANAANLLANAGLFAVWLLVPYYLLERRALSAGVGGLLFTAGPLAWGLAAPLGGRLADRGAGRVVASLALLMEAAALGLTGRLDGESSIGAIVAALALGGFGYGLFHVPNMHFVMRALPPARHGLAGSLVALMRTAGIVVGAQLTTLVYAGRLAAREAAGLAPGAAADGAFRDAFLAAAALAGLAAGLSLAVRPTPRLLEPGHHRGPRGSGLD